MDPDSELIHLEVDPPTSPLIADPLNPSTLPATPLWHVPPARSPHFAGRESLLQDLRASLAGTNESAHRQALLGMAGVGKTQVALEYAYRHREQYSLVWWLRAHDATLLDEDMTTLARALFPAAADSSAKRTRDLVLRALEARTGWLLVFDAVSDPNLIAEYLPSQRAGHVIITSRNANWRGIGKVFPIPPFDRNESIFFLQHRSGRKDSLLGASQVAMALGDLPLALDQAAALIEQTGISFETYLRRFENHWAELLSRGRSGQRQDSVAMSLEMVFRQLESTAPASAQLLNLLAFVGPEGFRKEWIAAGADRVGDTLAGTVGNPAYLNEALASLLRYSLIDLCDDTLSMHRLVGAMARDRMSPEDRTDNSHKALRLMDGAFQFDPNDPNTWLTSAAMLPHALATVDYAQQTDVTVATAAVLLNRVGQCLFRSARYEQARVALDRALAIGYQIYGESNPRLSAIANNLGRVLLRLGDLPAARQQFEWALSLDERTYGESHPHVAEILNNYGMCLMRQNEPEYARQQFERALAIYEDQAGLAHPSAASILNNLGCLSLAAGDLATAWDQLQRALDAIATIYGSNHPDVASILLNQGDVLRAHADPSAARDLYLRAMVIDESVYGPQHPDVARDLAHLAAVLLDLNELPAACRHFQRALDIDEVVYGPSHPNLLPRLNDLGRSLKLLGDIDRSADCFARFAHITRLHPPVPQLDNSDSNFVAA